MAAPSLLFSILALSLYCQTFAKPRPVFAEKRPTSVYDSAVNSRGEYFQLSRGGTGVSPTPPGCGSATPALLKYAPRTGKLLWAKCLIRMNDFGRIYFEKGKVNVISKKPSNLTHLIVEEIDTKTGDLLLPQPRLLTTSGDLSFGAKATVGLSRSGSLSVLFDSQGRTIRAFPANRVITAPPSTFISECQYQNWGSNFICVLTISDPKGIKPPTTSLAQINARRGTIVRIAPLNLLVGMSSDLFFVNVFTRVRGGFLWLSSTVAPFSAGSGANVDTMIISKISLRTLKPSYTQFVKISSQKFGFFALTTSFSRMVISTVVDVQLDGTGNNYKIAGIIIKGSKKERELVVVTSWASNGHVISAFPIQSDELSNDNGARNVDVLRDGTLIATGDYTARQFLLGKSSFVSLPKLYCKHIFVWARSCFFRRVY